MRLLLFVLCMPLAAQTLIDRQMLPYTNDKANKLFEEQHYEDALKIYQDLYGKDTKNGALAYNLGNAYAALGEMEKARDFYSKAIGSDNEEARQRSRFNLGNLQMGAKKIDEAVNQYVDYLHDRPGDIDAKRNLELALRELQQQEKQKKEDNKEDKEKKEGQEDQEQQQQQSEQNEDQEKDEQQQQQQQEQQKDGQEQDQQQQIDQGQEGEEKKEQSQEREDTLDEKMKEQILEALKEQEMEQQKEFQKRKIGKVRKRAKDW